MNAENAIALLDGNIAVAVQALLLSAWVALTIVFQFPWLEQRIADRDIFRIVPKWTFFSPHPGHFDLHFVFRDKLSDNTLTGWNASSFAETNYLPLIWNPGKRYTKYLWDTWSSIGWSSKAVGPSEYHTLQLNGAYILLLRFAINQDGSPQTQERQFGIVQSTGFEQRELKPLFVSSFHKMTPQH